MRIAQQTHLVSVQLDRRDIDLDLVELGYRAALNGDLPTMEQSVEQIRRLHKNALQVARAIAADGPVPSAWHRPSATACSSSCCRPESSSTWPGATGGSSIRC